MMIKPELVKRIKDYFNLNIYETKVWLALLSKGVASASEIAELSSVPRSRTYDVLESLEKMGFAISKVGKPSKYIAVNPSIVLEKLKKETLEKAEEKVSVLENLKNTREYSELESLHNSIVQQIKKEELSGMIKGSFNIIAHLKEIVNEAKKEAIICLPASELLNKTRVYLNLIEKLKAKRISIKLALKGSGEELKKVYHIYKLKAIETNLNSKFFVIDKEKILFALNNPADGDDELALWLNSPFFSETLSYLFELNFKK